MSSTNHQARVGKFCLFFVCVCFILSIIGNLNEIDRKLSTRWISFSDDPPIEIAFLTFSDFLQLNSDNISVNASLALVIPDRILDGFRGKVNSTNLQMLARILTRSKYLQVISGASLILDENEKPICSMERNGWTVDMRQDFSKFVDGTDSISLDHKCECYPCDLLPDVFLVDLSKTLTLIDDSLKSLGASARLPFFLKLKGQSAYCTDLEIVDQVDRAWRTLTCNNLSTIWDGHFLLLPRLYGIYRLVTHRALDQSVNGMSLSDKDSISTLQEYWLVCTWSKSAYDSGLPIHCSSWVRQFLFDMVDIIENRFGFDYRLGYGTVLGALRSKDVIPWTADIDIIVIKESGSGVRSRWKRLGEMSGCRYSDSDRNGDMQYPPLRAIPICPIALTALPPITDDQILDPNRTSSIDRLLAPANQWFSYDSWRHSGYVDIYESYLHSGYKCDEESSADKFEWIEISGRRFKTVVNPVAHVKCFYGVNWNTTPIVLEENWGLFTVSGHGDSGLWLESSSVSQ